MLSIAIMTLTELSFLLDLLLLFFFVQTLCRDMIYTLFFFHENRFPVLFLYFIIFVVFLLYPVLTKKNLHHKQVCCT